MIAGADAESNETEGYSFASALQTEKNRRATSGPAREELMVSLVLELTVRRDQFSRTYPQGWSKPGFGLDNPQAIVRRLEDVMTDCKSSAERLVRDVGDDMDNLVAGIRSGAGPVDAWRKDTDTKEPEAKSTNTTGQVHDSGSGQPKDVTELGRAHQI